MASITSVNLILQKTPISQAPSSPRTATVTFTTRFSLFEVQENTLFTANVSLRAVDSTLGTPLNIGSEAVRATDLTVQTTVTATLTRSTLDEDRDYYIWRDQWGHPHEISEELEDEWRARVILTPVIQTISRYSPIVRGSWGKEGNN